MSMELWADEWEKARQEEEAQNQGDEFVSRPPRTTLIKNQAEKTLQKLPDDLHELAVLWPRVPADVRAAIGALIRALACAI